MFDSLGTVVVCLRVFSSLWMGVHRREFHSVVMGVYLWVCHSVVMGMYVRVFDSLWRVCIYGCSIPWGWGCATGASSFGSMIVLLSADGSVLTGVPFQGRVVWGYLHVFVRFGEGCTYGCSATVWWLCMYSLVFRCCVMGVCILTGVPLLGDGWVYIFGHVCSTAVCWVCAYSRVFHCWGMSVYSRVFHCRGTGV